MNSLKRLAFNIWHIAGVWPRTYLGLVLGIEVLATGVVARKGTLSHSYAPVRLGIRELFESGHIHSAFLPVAYPALLAVGAKVGSHFGHRGSDIGMIAIQVVLLLAIVLLTRMIIQRMTGSARFATTTALVVGLYPPFLVKVSHINDTNLALFGMLLILLSVLELRSRLSLLSAIGAGAALACAMTIRPNLAPFLLLLVWAVWGASLRVALPLLLSAVGTLAIVYCSITGIIHGRPFFPQNGPYNFYAGFNSHTEHYLRTQLNAENSIVPAMAEDGISARLDWGAQSDRPGVSDVRDLAFRGYYTAKTREFIEQHPGQALRLTFLKLVVFLSPTPDFDVPKNQSHLVTIVTDVAKNVTLALIPIWLVLLGYSWRKRLRLGSVLMVAMVGLYLLAFVTTNSDPRFRIAIEGIVLIDIARMLYGIYRERRSMGELQ